MSTTRWRRVLAAVRARWIALDRDWRSVAVAFAVVAATSLLFDPVTPVVPPVVGDLLDLSGVVCEKPGNTARPPPQAVELRV